MKKNTVLIIGYVWLETTSAAGSRMLQLIELFKQNNWNITFASSAQKTENSLNLKVLNVEEIPILLNDSSFNDFIKELNPTIVVFDRFMIEEQYGWRIAENCPNALRILDTEDLHFLRKTRHQQLKKGESFTDDALLQSDDAKREIAAILRSDLSLIISSYEMDLLKKVFKISEKILLHLPFLIDKIENHYVEKWLPFEQRNHFVFMGNFLHKPNVDAVLTLKNHIWKHIKESVPNAELHIYGAYVSQQITQLHNKKEGFLIKGFAEDAQEIVHKAKVVLAPLRFGAGIKGKLTEAMVCGTPSITTTIGAEGMSGDLPWCGFVEGDFYEFARLSSELYTKKHLWKEAQNRGVEIINHIYNKEKNEAIFTQRVTEIQENLKAHRTHNFLGSLLQHQTLHATKYMSKWIEEKNKKATN